MLSATESPTAYIQAPLKGSWRNLATCCPICVLPGPPPVWRIPDLERNRNISLFYSLVAEDGLLGGMLCIACSRGLACAQQYNQYCFLGNMHSEECEYIIVTLSSDIPT